MHLVLDKCIFPVQNARHSHSPIDDIMTIRFEMHERHSLSLIQAANIFPLLEFISSQSIFQHAFQLHF